MSLKPFVIERFGGLNLLNDPQELGATVAVDMLNVDVDRDGRVRTRDGFAPYNTNVLAAAGYEGIWGARVNGGEILAARLVGGATLHLDRMTPAGALTDMGTWATTNGIITSVAHFGSATTSVVYMAPAPGPLPILLKKYDGAAIANSVGKPSYVAQYRNTTRLIQGHYFNAADTPSGANGTISTVFMSDEGAPDTYTATNFVPLSAGDGEGITGIVTFKEKTFVFKQTKMYVFFGETPDDDGLPIFNNRPVTLPTSIAYTPTFLEKYVVAGDDAVYFSSREGIYQTDGYEVKKISEPIDLMFGLPSDPSLPSSLTVSFASNPPSLTWARGKLHAYFLNSGTNPRTLVWDPSIKQWQLWAMGSSIRMIQLAEFPVETSSLTSTSLGPVAFFVYGQQSANHDIHRLAADTSGDNGVATSWNYTSGFYDLGFPGEKMLRFTDVYGSAGPAAASVTAQIVKRGERSGSVTDAGTIITPSLGSTPTIARARRAANTRGRMFAHKFSGTGPMVLTRLEHRYSLGTPT